MPGLAGHFFAQFGGQLSKRRHLALKLSLFRISKPCLAMHDQSCSTRMLQRTI
jgi:hypothetical protein